MKVRWALWLVSAAGSLAVHLALMSALSGMSLEAPPPPLADLYIADAASQAPLELNAIYEPAAVSLEAGIPQGQPVVAEAPAPRPVAATSATAGRLEAARTKPVEPPLASREEAAPLSAELRPSADPVEQAALDPPSQRAEPERPPEPTRDRTSTLAETVVTPDKVDPTPQGSLPAEPAARSVKPQPSPPTTNLEPSLLAETGETIKPLEAAVEQQSPGPAQPLLEEAEAPSVSAFPEAGPVAGLDPVDKPEPMVAAIDPPTEPAAASPRAVAPASTSAPAVEAAASNAAGGQGNGTSPALAESASTQGPDQPAASATPEPQGPGASIEQQRQQVAAQPPVSELPMPQRERIVRFLDGMQASEGGNCQHLEVSSPDGERPRLSGLVAAPEAIRDIGNAFQRAVGVRPEIGMHQVVEAQCPAVDFIESLRMNGAAPIGIGLSAAVAGGAVTLVGRLTRLTLPYTLLFTIDNDGIVHNLTDDLVPDAKDQIFDSEVYLAAGRRPHTQLLIAVGSSEPLEETNFLRIGDSASFLQQLRAEATAAGASLALGYTTFQVR